MKKITTLLLAVLGIFGAQAVKATTGVIIPIFDAAGESLPATPAEVTAWLGVSPGSGTGTMGRVTQQTNKTYAVYLDSAWGEVTMNGSMMSGGQAIFFVLMNNKIALSDLVLFNMIGGGSDGAYTIDVSSVDAGSCRFTVRNASASQLADPIVIRFSIMKGPAG